MNVDGYHDEIDDVRDDNDGDDNFNDNDQVKDVVFDKNRENDKDQRSENTELSVFLTYKSVLDGEQTDM